MAKAQRTVRRGPVQRRKFVWARASANLAVTASSFLSFDLLDQFEARYGAQLIGCTVMRVRGVVLLSPATDGSVGTGAYGIRTYSGDVADVLTEVDGPLEEPNADWMAYQPWAVGPPAGSEYSQQRDFVDVRAARKIDELDMGLAFAASNPFGGTVLNVRFHLSLGIKLP